MPRFLRRITAGVLLAALAACDGNSGPAVQHTHPALTTVDSLPLPASPYGVAISQSGQTWVSTLLGTVATDDSLPLDSLVTAGISLPSEAPHIAVNGAGTLAYVVCQTGRELAVIDASTRLVTTRIPLAHDGFNLITTRSGAQIFVSTSVGLVYTINAGTNQITDSIQLGGAVNGFALHPKDNRIYISSRDAGTVSEVDASSHAVLRTFMIGGLAQRIAVSPDGRELLVADESHGLDIWNLAAGLHDTTLLSTAYGLGLSPDGQKAYVTSGPGGLITVIDRIGRSVDTVLNVGGITRNVAFDRTGATAAITNESGFVTVVR